MTIKIKLYESIQFYYLLFLITMQINAKVWIGSLIINIFFKL